MAGTAAAESEASTVSLWPHRLALLAGGATCLLVVIGGLVTTTHSGMAVPDWPTTFGYNMFLYPWDRLVGGVLYEHVHRLAGSAVGLLTLLLTATIWGTEREDWLRLLGLAALGGVIVQGVLGGLRVVLAADILAMVHGAVAPGFLALLASLALFTSSPWRAGGPAEAPRHPGLFLGTTVAIYVQIVFGVILAHRETRLDAHAGMAGLVSVLVVLSARRAFASGLGRLRRPAWLLVGLWAVQIVLGLAAFAVEDRPDLLPVAPELGLALLVAHRLVGALMLSGSLVLTLQAYRPTRALGAAHAPGVSGRVPA